MNTVSSVFFCSYTINENQKTNNVLFPDTINLVRSYWHTLISSKATQNSSAMREKATNKHLDK
jgi:hypothetical protein